MATDTKPKPQQKPNQRQQTQTGEIIKNQPDPKSTAPANLRNQSADHYDSKEDARKHRVEELVKEVEHHLVGAAETFGEYEEVMKAAKDLVPVVQGRVRKIGETAKTEDAFERDADEAIKAAEQHVINLARAEQKRRKKEDEKKKEEEKKKHGGPIKRRMMGDVPDPSTVEKGKVTTQTEESESSKTNPNIQRGGFGKPAEADALKQAQETRNIAFSPDKAAQIRNETEAKMLENGITPLKKEIEIANTEPPATPTNLTKQVRDSTDNKKLENGIIPDDIHTEIAAAIAHDQKQKQPAPAPSSLTPDAREAARKRISRGGSAKRASGTRPEYTPVRATTKTSPAAAIPATTKLAASSATKNTSSPADGKKRKMGGTGPSANRPRVNLGPAVTRRVIPGGGAVGAAAAANYEEAYVAVGESEHNDRGKYLLEHNRKDPGTFVDTDRMQEETTHNPNPQLQRGGLGVPNSPPPDIQRKGLGQSYINAEKQHAKKMIEHAAERRVAWMVLRSPAFWYIMFWVFVAFIVIMVLVSLFAYEGNEKQNQACTQPTETMKQRIVGPKDGTVGPELTYEIHIEDTLPNQEVTTVVTIPPGQTFIRSSWARFTQSANVLTFKATENLPPNSLSPPKYFFTVTLTAKNPNSTEVLKAETTPGRAGGAGAGGAGGTVIVLDPGHGQESNITDPATGLIDRESANTPEREEVFDVAKKVQEQLKQKGYTVVLTKDSAEQGMTHRKRADFANSQNAAIAVSIHNDHGQPFSWSEIYTQKVGLYREANGKRVEFTDAALAAKSLEYANKIAEARAAAEGRPVPLRDANFDARVGYSSGNIPLVMLFATVPWVYNEIGAAPVGVRVPQDQIDKYALGIANGIEQAIPLSGSAAPAPGNGCAPGTTPGAGGPLPNEVRDIPPSTSDCGGKYKLTSPFNNFGDPLCDYDNQKANELIKKYDPADAYKWDAIDDCESGNNPNAYLRASASGKGAYGLYQMNPDGQGNGEFDAGNVIWDQQIYNAINYHEQKLGGKFNYWACAIK